MSANRPMNKESGFTLIEVTLAIVIGVVVIAGATVLYNQAKNSAANTAAQNKVNAAAATIEEFAAKNFGQYPTGTQFQTIWQRNRPDDFGSSPWGGPTGTAAGVIVADAWGTVPTAATTPTAANAGVIEYRRGNTTPTEIFDMQREATVSVRNYALWIYNDKGVGPNFTVGGK